MQDLDRNWNNMLKITMNSNRYISKAGKALHYSNNCNQAQENYDQNKLKIIEKYSKILRNCNTKLRD